MNSILRNETLSFYLCLVFLPILISIIIILINKPIVSFVTLGVVIFIVITFINFDLLIYILLALWPIVSYYIPKESTKYFWIIICLFFLIMLLSKLMTNRRLRLPPKELLYFFGVFWLLIIFSDVYNLQNISLIDNLRLIFFTVLIFIFYDWSFNKPPSRIILCILFPLIISIIMVLVTILKNFSLMGFLQLTFFRYSAFFGNPNNYGNYLNFVIPLIFSFLVMKYYKRYYYIILFIFILSFLALIISNSRAAYLGVGSSIIILSLLIKRIRLPVLIFLGLLIFVFIYSPFFRQITNFILRIGTDPTSGRADIWASAMSILRNNYIFGIGLGNQTCYLVEELPTAFSKHIMGNIMGAHNLYLSKALEIGILAIPLFLYLFFILGRIIIFNTRSKLPLEQRALNFAALGVLISLFVRSFFEGSVLIQRGGIFPVFYSWIILSWPMQIHQKIRKYKSTTK